MTSATPPASGGPLLPSWLPNVLLAAAVPGVVASLFALWWSFVGTGVYMDPSFPPPADVSLVIRAGWWLDIGGFSGPFATLTALVAFGWASAHRRSDGAVEPVVPRLVGGALACVMAIVQTAGLLAVVVGAAILLNATGGQSLWTTFNRYELTSLGSTLVLAVLFVVLAWVLRSRLVAEAVWPGSTPDPAPEPPGGRRPPVEHPKEDNEIRWGKQTRPRPLDHRAQQTSTSPQPRMAGPTRPR